MKRKIGVNERMGRKRDEELAEIMAAIEAAHQAVADTRPDRTLLLTTPQESEDSK